MWFLLRKTNVYFGLQSFGKSTKQLRVNHSSSFFNQARLHFFDYSWSSVDNSNSSMTLHSSNTLPVEFDSGGFLLWKPIKCLKRSNNRSFRICGWGKHGQRNHIEMSSFFEKPRFQSVGTFTLKRGAGVFNFLRFESRLQKAPFSWRISVDSRPN